MEAGFGRVGAGREGEGGGGGGEGRGEGGMAGIGEPSKGWGDAAPVLTVLFDACVVSHEGGGGEGRTSVPGIGWLLQGRGREGTEEEEGKEPAVRAARVGY